MDTRDLPDMDRRGAWWMLTTSVIVTTLLAWWLVPWEWVRLHPTSARAGDYFTAAELERAEQYAAYVRPRADLSLALGLLIICLLGLTRWGRGVLTRLVGSLPWWVAVPIAVLVLQVVVRLARLPLAWQLRDRRLEEGLTRQPAVEWWVDQGLSLLVTWVVTSLLVMLLIGCARRWPRRWYLPVGAAGLLAVYLLSFAYPLVVEPLFNDFTPLADEQLRTDLVEISRRQGVDVGEVLVADASRRTTTLNAYVSGFGESKRLVLYDTLIADAPPDEVEAVVAHEVAHAAEHDVLAGTTVAATALLVGVAGLALVLDRGERGRARSPVATWQIMALVALVSVLVTPVQNTISRAIEARADAHSLESLGDPQPFVDLQVRLAQRSLADPTPPRWRQLWWGSHPTVLERLATAETSGRANSARQQPGRTAPTGTRAAAWPAPDHPRDARSPRLSGRSTSRSPSH